MMKSGRKFLLVFIFSAAQSLGAAEKKSDKIEKKEKSVAESLTDFRKDLAQAEIKSIKLGDGDVLVLAHWPGAGENEDKSDDSHIVQKVELLLQKKDETSWKVLSSLNEPENDISLNDKGLVEVSGVEGGSVSDESKTKWRLKDGQLQLIGEDYVIIDRTAFNRESKSDPVKQYISVNYLTGQIIEKREFYNGKQQSKNCSFETSKFADFNFNKNAGSGPALNCEGIAKSE